MVDSVKLIWANTAINDRQSIYDYIELDNPIAANHLDGYCQVNGLMFTI